MLEDYYRTSFPFEKVFEWIHGGGSGGSDAPPCNREFAFVFAENVYRRHLCFPTWQRWREEAVRLVPLRMEIGAIYTQCSKWSEPRFAIGRELTFDIDMNDYAELRRVTECCACGDEKRACKKCWIFIRAAVRILEFIFRNLFGFEKIQWVFSGRRGIHCWIFDRRAFTMSKEERERILEIISSARTLQRRAPTIHQQLFGEKKIQQFFAKQIVGGEERWVDSDAKCQYVIDHVYASVGASATDNQRATNVLQKEISNGAKWWKCVQRAISGSEVTMNDVIAFYTWPRLDGAVTTHVEHLIKSPFAVHPDTGRVCVPFDDIEAIDRFDPENDNDDLLQQQQQRTQQ